MKIAFCGDSFCGQTTDGTYPHLIANEYNLIKS